MRILIGIIYLSPAIIISQLNNDPIKVIKYKSTWKVYRSGVEMPKSHFFRLVEEEEKMIIAIENEKDFLKKKFKLGCFMCGNSTIGMLSLMMNNQQMISSAILLYLVTNTLRRSIKIKEIDVSIEEAKAIAKEYNNTISGKSELSI